MRKVQHAHAGKRTSTHDLASQTATTCPEQAKTLVKAPRAIEARKRHKSPYDPAARGTPRSPGDLPGRRAI